MLIYESIEDANAGEPGLRVTPQGEYAEPGTVEADWGYRLRGAGLPGGKVGWLLTFAGSGYDSTIPVIGWLIAYEIAHNEKTGRVAVLRREWDSVTDKAELARIRKQETIWDYTRRHEIGEGDLDTLDAHLVGVQLPNHPVH